MERFLRPEAIPRRLWDGEETLLLPDFLVSAYRSTLRKVDLFEEADRAHSDRAIGGVSKEETDKHFVNRFAGSCARTQLAILDPADHLGDSSNLFIRVFSGGHIRILDIPCGCGAASAVLLSTIAELRRENIVPREPLDISLTGGDISDTARCYADLIYSELGQTLTSEAIFLRHNLYSWDITKSTGTTCILNEWIEDSTHSGHSFLLIANWSGFLNDRKNQVEAEKQLEKIFQWAEDNNCGIAWIEPPMKQSTLMWIHKLFGKLVAGLRQIFGRTERPPEQRTSKMKFVDPIRGKRHLVRIQLGGLGGLTH